MSIGLNVATKINDSDSIKQFVEKENKNTIRLTFPNLDFGGQNYKHLKKYWDEDVFVPNHAEIGSLVPHLILEN